MPYIPCIVCNIATAGYEPKWDPIKGIWETMRLIPPEYGHFCLSCCKLQIVALNSAEKDYLPQTVN